MPARPKPAAREPEFTPGEPQSPDLQNEARLLKERNRELERRVSVLEEKLEALQEQFNEEFGEDYEEEKEEEKEG